jgi:CHAD domain-containing protein
MKLLPKSGLPAAAALEPAIRAYRKEQVKLLLPALRNWGSRHTSSKWRTAVAPNGLANEELDVAGAAPRLLKRLLKRGGRATSGEDLNRLRIEGKKLRYTAELLQEKHPALEPLANLQTILGSVNDARAVRALVIDLGGAGDVERWLKKRQKKQTRAFHAEWPAIEQALRAALAAPARRKPAGRSTPPARPIALHA